MIVESIGFRKYISASEIYRQQLGAFSFVLADYELAD
jgi:hypothetical protein